MTQKWRPHPYGLLIIILLLLGVCLRFYNLDHKLYWHDETFTSLRASGYQSQEYLQALFDGHLVSVADLQTYQTPRPNSSLGDVINSLAIEDAQHPPLYYALMWGWIKLWGHSPTITRLLSVFLSLFAFPALYWLCIELFAAPLVGGVAMALMAVSPLHLLYAQEARQYSFWVVWILLSSAGLLRAIRVKTVAAWGFYSITLVLGCYTFLFNIFVALGHALYVVGLRQKAVLKPYLWACGLGVIGFSPWLVVLLTNFQNVQATTGWTARPIAAGLRTQLWGWNLSHLVFDIGLQPYDPWAVSSAVLVMVLVLFAMGYLCHHAPPRAGLMVISLIGVTPLVLCSLDLSLGGLRSISARYFMATYVGLDIAIAYLLAHPLTLILTKRHLVWKGMAAILFTLGLTSCLVVSQSDTWWIKAVAADNATTARIINQAERPLVISSQQETNPGSLLSLSYLLEPRVKFQLIVDPKVPDIPS
ncbi:MAG: glycosyltransferase family 39 protein, partial [Thermosynechococcaceae cyanobacterium]